MLLHPYRVTMSKVDPTPLAPRRRLLYAFERDLTFKKLYSARVEARAAAPPSLRFGIASGALSMS